MQTVRVKCGATPQPSICHADTTWWPYHMANCLPGSVIQRLLNTGSCRLSFQNILHAEKGHNCAPLFTPGSKGQCQVTWLKLIRNPPPQLVSLNLEFRLLAIGRASEKSPAQTREYTRLNWQGTVKDVTPLQKPCFLFNAHKTRSIARNTPVVYLLLVVSLHEKDTNMTKCYTCCRLVYARLFSCIETTDTEYQLAQT